MPAETVVPPVKLLLPVLAHGARPETVAGRSASVWAALSALAKASFDNFSAFLLVLLLLSFLVAHVVVLLILPLLHLVLKKPFNFAIFVVMLYVTFS